MITVGSRLDDFKGRGPGFDSLRLFLSVSVLWSHTFGVAYGSTQFHSVAEYSRPFTVVLLPLFFSLSGFLVSGSVFRTKDVRVFLLFRSLRIFPALIVEITLSALVLGPIVTQFTLEQYFGHSDFVAYFLNIFGLVRYVLPGVFTSNPEPNIVNVSLWTVPIEMYCYLLISLLIVFGFIQQANFVSIIYVALTLLVFSFDYFRSPINPILPFPTRILLLYFVGGGADLSLSIQHTFRSCYNLFVAFNRVLPLLLPVDGIFFCSFFGLLCSSNRTVKASFNKFPW